MNTTDVMSQTEKEHFREKASLCVHDLRGSITVFQLLLSCWERKLTPEQQSDYPMLIHEIEKMKTCLNNFSEVYKSL